MLCVLFTNIETPKAEPSEDTIFQVLEPVVAEAQMGLSQTVPERTVTEEYFYGKQTDISSPELESASALMSDLSQGIPRKHGENQSVTDA